jgi:AraC family transcriptional regulator of arabinose operon
MLEDYRLLPQFLDTSVLLDTELTISEIGYKLGYADPHYFSNLFRSKMNVRPSHFRKTFRKIQ